MHALKSNWRLVACAALLALGLLIMHGLTGTPEGSSYQYNLPWFDAFSSAFWKGDLYPRFSPDLWYGMGALDFYFYGPLPFWVASVIGPATCPGCDTGTAFSVAGAWLIILSGVSFFVFAKRFFATAWAGFGGMLYAVLPYHYFADWFDRQAIGEVAAYLFIPLIALAMTKLIEERKGGILFAVSFAGLALSHLPSTLIMGHLIVLIAIWVAVQLTSWSARIALLARFAAWGLLGTGLSAIYWVPALGLLNTVSPDMLMTDYFHATNWLLLDGIPEVSAKVSVYAKACLTLIVVTAVLASLVMKREKASSSLWLWIIGPSLFAFFFMTVFSYPIWKFWILNKVQFPWRSLVVGDLALTLGAIVVARFLVQNRTGEQAIRARVFAGVTAGLLLTAYLVQVPRVSETVQAGSARAGAFNPVGAPEYVTPIALERALTRFRETVSEADSGEDRFTLFFNQMKHSSQQAMRVFQSDAPGAVLTPLSHDRVRLDVGMTDAGTVRLPLFAWPYWRAESLDGRAIEVSADDALGLLTVDLPAGQSETVLYLAESAPQKLGSLLSMLSLIVMFGSIGIARFQRESR